MSRNPFSRPLAAAIAIEAVWALLLAAGLIDRRIHEHDTVDGVNQWGYRDDARGSKQAGEVRVAIVGGSSAFEGGTRHDQTLAGQLFFELRQAGAPEGRSYSVVNLSEPRAGADTYIDALRDYGYLQPDVVCVFDGYDVLEGVPPHGRRRSAVFRTTGYLPVLPALLLRREPYLSDADAGVAPTLRDDGSPDDVTCAGASAAYCAAIAGAVEYGLLQQYAVMVVSPPSVSRRHSQQQQSLGEFLHHRFEREPRFLYLDLRTAIDWSSREESLDRIHRTGIGNHVVGQKIATAIVKWRGY